MRKKERRYPYEVLYMILTVLMVCWFKLGDMEAGMMMFGYLYGIMMTIFLIKIDYVKVIKK